MHLEYVHYHFGAGDFSSLLVSNEPEMALKALRYITLHGVPVTNVPSIILVLWESENQFYNC